MRSYPGSSFCPIPVVFQALSLEQIASENEIPAEEPGDEGPVYISGEPENQDSGAEEV